MSFLTVLGSSEQWTREMVAPRAKKAKSVEANDRFNIERRFRATERRGPESKQDLQTQLDLTGCVCLGRDRTKSARCDASIRAPESRSIEGV